MSERVVFEAVPGGKTPPDWIHAGTFIEAGGKFYRRIPDPVPALKARIAELEGEVSMLQRRSTRLWQLIENFTAGVRRCPKCDSFAMQGYECDVCAKPPTPAAAKEQ